MEPKRRSSVPAFGARAQIFGWASPGPGGRWVVSASMMWQPVGVAGAVGGRPELSRRQSLLPETSLRTLPGILQSIGLLPQPQEALEATVRQALAHNPMLRQRARRACAICGRYGPAYGAASCAHQPRDSGPGASIRPFDSLEAIAGCEIKPEYRHALSIVFAHLGDRGLLDDDPEIIASEHHLSPAAVTEAVRVIKSVGPVGIAERSVTALLVAQARALVARGEAASWFVELVRTHLPAVAAADVQAVSTALGLEAPVVSRAFELVRTRLRPFVGMDGDRQTVPVVPPDVFLNRAASGRLEVEVADSRWFGLRLVAVPAGLQSNREAAQWLRKHQQAAQLLLGQIDARANVLRRVATWAVEWQSHFFEVGAAGHVPLTRSQVAAELGLHSSTVSRAVCGKKVRCPDGSLMDFADLFGGARAVKSRIVELTENGSWSDARLAHELAASGFSVARRTVAKYRAELGISPAPGRS